MTGYWKLLTYVNTDLNKKRGPVNLHLKKKSYLDSKNSSLGTKILKLWGKNEKNQTVKNTANTILEDHPHFMLIPSSTQNLNIQRQTRGNLCGPYVHRVHTYTL